MVVYGMERVTAGHLCQSNAFRQPGTLGCCTFSGSHLMWLWFCKRDTFFFCRGAVEFFQFRSVQVFSILHTIYRFSRCVAGCTDVSPVPQVCHTFYIYATGSSYVHTTGSRDVLKVLLMSYKFCRRPTNSTDVLQVLQMSQKFCRCLASFTDVPLVLQVHQHFYKCTTSSTAVPLVLQMYKSSIGAPQVLKMHHKFYRDVPHSEASPLLRQSYPSAPQDSYLDSQKCWFFRCPLVEGLVTSSTDDYLWSGCAKCRLCLQGFHWLK